MGADEYVESVGNRHEKGEFVSIGNPAVSERPVAFRPCLAAGLAFSMRGPYAKPGAL
jgi:hypothetical protein